MAAEVGKMTAALVIPPGQCHLAQAQGRRTGPAITVLARPSMHAVR